MVCISSKTRADLLAELAILKEQLAAAQAAFTTTLTGIKSYKFDSGEGSQQTEYTNPKELRQLVTFLKGDIAAIEQRLNGSGVTTINLRRKNYGRGYYG